MASVAIEKLKTLMPSVQIFRRTVPGIKDIPVAVKKLMVEKECDAGMVFGWVGPSLTDKISYAVYSLAIQMVQLDLLKPIVDVTVHEDEAEDEKTLYRVAVDRAEKHAENLYLMLYRPDEMEKRAGTGRRQGWPDVGPILP
jgi:riboflavin synthase